MDTLNIPLFSIKHQMIGGTEGAIYSLVKGLHVSGFPVKIIASDVRNFSTSFQTWLTSSNVRVEVCGVGIGHKNTRFLNEALFEWGRSVHGWALYPNYFLPPSLHFRKRKSAVIIHDIQYKSLPQYHSAHRRGWLDLCIPYTLKKADHIFVISEAERDLIASHFGDEWRRRSSVLYNSVDWDRFNEVPGCGEQFKEQTYILTVFHNFPHKNVRTLLSAFDLVAQRDSDVVLNMVGTGTEDNIRLVAECVAVERRSRVRFLGYIDEPTLGALYRHAAVFAQPSLYEGFGLPAVEALGMGIQTVVSDIPALREVTLGRAAYVANPLDANEWAERLLSALRRPLAVSASTQAEIRSKFSQAAASNAVRLALEA